MLAGAIQAVPRLVPSRVIALDPAMGKHARDVAWSGDGKLVIATERAVFESSLGGGPPATLISGEPVPNGLSDPTAVSSDGNVAAAVTYQKDGGFVVRIADRKRLVAQQMNTLQAWDIAVGGGRQCVLGFPLRHLDDAAAVWCGKVDESWETLQPVHRLHSTAARDAFHEPLMRHAGAVSVGADGSVWVVTSVEPGLFHYSAEGRLIEVLGGQVDELLYADAAHFRDFAVDVQSRYRSSLNTQPTIDDLLITAAGPAILVRLVEGRFVRWELWYPDRDGGARRRLRLGIDRLGPFGHLRCAARGTAMACAGSLPPAADAEIIAKQFAHSRIWLFDLSAKR